VLSVQYGLQDDYLFDTDEMICSARGGEYKTAFNWVGGQWKEGKVQGFCRLAYLIRSGTRFGHNGAMGLDGNLVRYLIGLRSRILSFHLFKTISVYFQNRVHSVGNTSSSSGL
jgi:hypothetical protein